MFAEKENKEDICAKLSQNLSIGQKVIERTNFRPLTSICDLDLQAADLRISRDTPSHQGGHLCQVTSKSVHCS
jgi:hypothetical protein